MSDRRVLMLCMWPPWAKVGARRPVRLARRLPALGWTPVVLTPEPADADGRFVKLDPTLSAPDVEVVRPRALFPSARLLDGATALLERAGQGHRAGLVSALVRDLRLIDQFTEWLPAALNAARKLGPIDAVWATGSPYGFFPTALALGKQLKAPVVFDYRDPWTPPLHGAGRNPIRWPRSALSALEARLLCAADAVSFVTPETREQYRRVFGQTPGAAWRVIPNGFAPEERAVTPPLGTDRPTLVHAGNCYGSRSLAPVLKALDAVRADRPALRVRQLGVIDAAAEAALANAPLPEHFDSPGRVDQIALAGHLAGAAALLMLVGDEHADLVPGKLFDYWLYDRPILAVGPAQAAARRLIETTGTGQWVTSTDTEGLRAALRAVADGTLPYAPNRAAIAPYSADAMAEATAALLDTVTGRSA